MKWDYKKYIRSRGNVFTELLCSNDKGGTHTDTQTNERDVCSAQLRKAQVP
jgi:hypothetical protein